uniref:NADH dehydrogenase subunit 5 n=1 Tax=Forcipomyia pulchrithorax TaxID=3042879 RepID=UPI002A80E181|nr:NADH dehydrogenase subunit 5 [Forcipomyia pulchrithorax]WOR86765.1 NADH dehydrogenase subunit 5 [Forcipomyia pulchrithorax]
MISICLISSIFLMCVSLSTFLSGLYFLMNELVVFYEFELVSINSSLIVMTILLDWMSLFFLSFVSLISALVVFYSMEYMASDMFINRFILLVLMFVLSMYLLIISPNLISILLGWDGLGLVSYCLVIYFQNVKSYNAGMLTALSNRIGDVMILLSVAWMLNFGSWNYIFYLELMREDFEMTLIGVMLVFAAMTKSAQIPFSAWLPAAMAAPTPVSALVHSSTLVTAGVYLLIRFNSLIVNSAIAWVLLLLGGLTMFMAGLGANFEYDLKKIIALSTLSQLGLMMSILSMGFASLAFFHLLTHALFKALLFMCAGVVIHSMKNFQDIRYMGSLVGQLPLTISCFNVANLALCGMPFLAGFYSKDMILEISSFSEINVISYFLYFFSTGLTVCYSLRLMYFTMYANFSSWAFHPLYDSSKIMTTGMMGLLVMSIMGGCMLSWIIFPVPYVIVIPSIMKLMVPIVCILGAVIGGLLANWSLYLRLKSKSNFMAIFFMGSMWFLPTLSTVGTVFTPLSVSMSYMKSLDYGWLESLGGQNLNYTLSKASGYLQIFQNNSLKIYLMMFFLWISIYLILSI